MVVQDEHPFRQELEVLERHGRILEGVGVEVGAEESGVKEPEGILDIGVEEDLANEVDVILVIEDHPHQRPILQLEY
eukprot:CAMPEP_0184307352 /NCGR_PEP_ID=MMETSP1049-20130417/16124_1 /TAXON_ID=77928 /ORGANISM="Proteomonas sulcata, Strain CCMP704" /LENGTH=76 /DNA_ID=CAMNT_0026619831 /DNA_START=1047 /DNA_END=1277 /DNA_ORIENTATION=-